jgi:hypothetical protein
MRYAQPRFVLIGCTLLGMSAHRSAEVVARGGVRSVTVTGEPQRSLGGEVVRV